MERFTSTVGGDIARAKQILVAKGVPTFAEHALDPSRKGDNARIAAGAANPKRRTPATESPMRQRTRKLVGTVVILVFVCVYALVAMALAQGRITEAPKLVQTFAYIALGLAWVLPLLPLIKWMERRDEV
jgi:hypothetical protein